MSLFRTGMAVFFVIFSALPSMAVEDYSKDFAEFYQLGLPDVSKAEYVELGCNEAVLIFSSDPDIRGRRGNAWLIKNDDDGSALFVFENAIQIKIYDSGKLLDAYSKAHRLDRNPARGFEKATASKIKGIWSTIELKDEPESVLKKLPVVDKKKIMQEMPDPGPLYLYAIHIYSKGFKDEANKIIERLIEQEGSRNAVLMYARNALANEQYTQAMAELRLDADWTRFASALEILLKKYPEDWTSAPEVSQLLMKVRKQIANPLPEIKGEGISEEDKKLAAGLADVRILPFPVGRSLVLPACRGDCDSLNDDVLENIMDRGKDSIPMLIELLKEDTLIPAAAKNSYYARENDDLGIVYPAQRKDIARIFLIPSVIVPGFDDNCRLPELPDDELVAVCRKWYNEIKDKNYDEMELYYLKNGNVDQKEDAVASMMKGDLDRKGPVLEEFFLSVNNDDLFTLYDIDKYVEKRKMTALPFIEKLKVKFKDELAALDTYNKNEKMPKKKVKSEDDEDDDEYSLEDLKSLKDKLDELYEIASAKTAREIVDEILSGKADPGKMVVRNMLMERLSSMSNDDAIGLLLYGAGTAEKGSLKIYFLEELSRSCWWGCGASIEKNAEAWKKLLADESLVQGYKVNFIVPFLIERIYGGEKGSKTMDECRERIGNRTFPIIKKRAEERLAGKSEKELAPYPEIRKLDKNSKASLVAKLEKAADEKNLNEFLKSLSDNEFAALPGLIGENPGLNATLRSYANRIVSVHVSLDGEDKSLESFRNTVLDLAAIGKIQEYCKKLTASGKPFRCEIFRRPRLQGIELTLSPAPEYRFPGMSEKSSVPSALNQSVLYMWGNVSCDSDSTGAVWRILREGRKPVRTSENMLEQIETRDEKFNDCLKKLFGDSNNCGKSFTINYQLE